MRAPAPAQDERLQQVVAESLSEGGPDAVEHVRRGASHAVSGTDEVLPVAGEVVEFWFGRGGEFVDDLGREERWGVREGV